MGLTLKEEYVDLIILLEEKNYLTKKGEKNAPENSEGDDSSERGDPDY